MELRLRFSLLKVEQTDPIKASVDLLYSPPVFRGLNDCCSLTEIKKISLRKWKYEGGSCLEVGGEDGGNNPLRGRRVYLPQHFYKITPPCTLITFLQHSNYNSIIEKNKNLSKYNDDIYTLLSSIPQNYFEKIHPKIMDGRVSQLTVYDIKLRWDDGGCELTWLRLSEDVWVVDHVRPVAAARPHRGGGRALSPHLALALLHKLTTNRTHYNVAMFVLKQQHGSF